MGVHLAVGPGGYALIQQSLKINILLTAKFAKW